MNYEVRKVSSDYWRELSEKAHIVMFGETGRADIERVDFALLALGDGDLGGYMTGKEMDKNTLYIQYGGVFRPFEGSIHVLRGYRLMVSWCRENYRNVWTRIENTNTAMLKMALAMDFIVTGASMFENKLFLELTLKGRT